MVPSFFKNLRTNTSNSIIINNILLSRNFSKKSLIGCSDEYIEMQIKMISSADLVPKELIGSDKENEIRKDLYNQAVSLRDSLEKKDITKVQSIYRKNELDLDSNYARGQKSQLFSGIFSSVINYSPITYKNIYEFSSKGLSELVQTRNKSNVILPPNASDTNANSWKNSYEIVDAKKHGSQKNLGEDLKIIISQDKTNSDFFKNEVKGIVKVGESPQNYSDASYVYTTESGFVRSDKDFKRRMIKKTDQSDHESHELNSVGNESKSKIESFYQANCNKHLNSIELKRKYGNLTKQESEFLDKAEIHIKNFKIDQSEKHLNELDKIGYPFRQFINDDEIIR